MSHYLDTLFVNVFNRKSVLLYYVLEWYLEAFLFSTRSFSMNFWAEWLKLYLNTRNSFPTHTLFSEKLITQMVRKRWSLWTKNIYSWWCMSSWYDIEKNLFIRQVRRSWIVNRRELQKGLAFFINVHNWTVRWCQKYIPSSTLIYGKK